LTPCNAAHPIETYLVFLSGRKKSEIRAAVVCTRFDGHDGDHRGYGTGMRLIRWDGDSDA
jgi:hypothetical protein